MAAIGSVIDGKYEILKLIGKGGMSKVYLAIDKRLNKQWAVKEIRKKDENNEVQVQGLIAEANLMKKLDHPSLPRIVDIIQTKETIYIIMDYIKGKTLNTILKEYGVQSQELIIDWAKQLCGVLHYLHTRTPAIIYRDMKPGNVMLSPDGNIKLIDFGIAREYKEEQLQDTVSLGTKGYAAPEQFNGKGQTDARTDIYCLGVTLYHLLTGKNPCEPPYEIYPIRYWNSSLSAGLEKIITKCTQLNPKDRYQSCAELMYALENYDKEDDAYRFCLKKKLAVFLVSASLTALSCITGVTSQVLKIKAENENYEVLLEEGKSSINKQEAEAYYQNAIDVKPEDFRGYYALVELYKEDTVFTIEEQEVLVRKINENLSMLKEQQEYPYLAFEVGKLYWYYYQYGNEGQEENNQITRMKYSIKWFEDVINVSEREFTYYKMAEVYYQIGVFHRDIMLDMEEASDKGKYKPYFENLKKLLEEMGEQESDIVTLELNKLVLNSIENYGRKLKADGISKEELLECLETVIKSTKNIPADTEKTIEIKEYIQTRYKEAVKSVELVYED
ncbi:MAG: serine/threonine protein kinase [Lachnospiraceae bacterium]|nr:serine/threonine protein kinase [Lachnospiraceae bacterium]